MKLEIKPGILKIFIHGIKIFLDNDNLRKNAGINGRELVMEKFTLNRMIKEYIRLYEEVYEAQT
ncbi:MAG: glycosyltransferase family 4 protein [Bacteroidales bacterium]|nr:glycosyltransferase family 4 protein [Bacteroidales bacterium]